MPLSKDILKIATLGTAHHGLDLSVLGEGEQPERQLLQIAAENKLPERVGWIPKVDENPLPETRLPDQRAIANFEATKLLWTSVDYGKPSRSNELERIWSMCVNTWLGVFQAREKRIAPELMQNTIQLVSRFGKQRSQILELLDNNSRKLVVDYPFESIVLQFLLHRDVNPSVRQRFVETWWDQAYLRDRYKMLEMMEGSVLEGDEAFLESLIDTASPPMLRRVCGLLAELLDSKFSRLMRDYLPKLIGIKVMNGEQSLVVDVYKKLDDPMLQRYGVVEKKINRSTARYRILSYIPPSFWCEVLEISPNTFVDLLADQQRYALWKVLAAASHRYKEDILADVLFDHAYFRLDQREKGLVAELMTEEKLQISGVEMMNEHQATLSKSHPALPLIFAYCVEWKPIFVQAFICMIHRNITDISTIPRFENIYLQLFVSAAFYTPLTMRHELLSIFDDYDDARGTWRKVREQMQRIMEFRQELLDVLETGSI